MKIPGFKLFSVIHVESKHRAPVFGSNREGRSGLLERARSCELYWVLN